MTAWFPLACALETYGWEEISPEESVPRIQSLRVSVDGVPVDYAVNELPNPNGADKPLLSWASFPVTFPAGKDTMIHVSYVLPLNRSGNALALYYIFQTGAGWAGPIGQAELILNLPYPASLETLAGMPSGSLNPPYFVYFGDEVAGLPPGGVLEGNQARWTWKDLEPGPQDDFSILLVDLGKWDELQAARAAVKATPGDGQAWLKLCTTYHSLGSRRAGQIPAAWGDTYRPLGVQACQEAAHLLPGDAAPHYGLALFHLLALSQNPSPAALQLVLDELRLGQELEAVQPPSEVFFYDTLSYSSISEYINDMVSRIFTDATATANAGTRAAATPTKDATLTPAPSATAQPLLTVTKPAATTPTSFPQGTRTSSLTLIAAISVILIVAVVYLVLKRRM
jgi:hypothetical protein